MLGVNQLDFLNYTTAFKGNYRKGVHKLRAILSNKTHAEEFARNKGGVAVVLGVPVDAPDKNSDALLALLMDSSVAELAVETLLTFFFEFDTYDTLLASRAVCQKIVDTPLLWRSASASKVTMGKIVATLAGLSCADYADMGAVAASSTAMAAVTANSAARAAMLASNTAMAAVAANSNAMTAVAANSALMAAVIASAPAIAAVTASNTAMTAVAANSTAMAAVAASSNAMAAVAASAPALNAIVKNATASTTVIDLLQPLRTTVAATLTNGTNYFTKTTKTIGNGAGSWDDGAGTNTYYLPVACSDDGDTDFAIFDLLKQAARLSLPKHSGISPLTVSLCMRGARTVGTGSSVGNVVYDVYTAI